MRLTEIKIRQQQAIWANARRVNMESQRQQMAQGVSEADALLRSHLDADQLADYDECGAFAVLSQNQHVYVIIYQATTNVWAIERMHWLCLRLDYYNPPIPNMLLMQKLLLETDEAHFLKVAIVH